MAIRLGRWDCPVCGQIGNLGNQVSCPSCSSPRGKDVEFYLPSGSNEITDAQLLKEANAGVDWRCDYCDSDNKAIETKCKSCGNEKTESDINRQSKEYALNEVPTSGQNKKSNQNKDIDNQKKQHKPKSIIKKLLFVFGIIIILLVIFLMPRSFKVEVIKHTWFRAIEIENNRLITEEDWKMPASAISLKDSFKAIHHYDKVLSHYQNRTRTVRERVGSERYVCGSIDKGNGYFEDKYCDRPIYESRQESYQEPIYKDVPVYATKYRYTIYRWIKDHDISEKGEDKNPKWPVEHLVDNNWREGTKSEKYMLYLRDKKGKEYNQEVDYNLWSSINLNQEIYAKKNSMGGFYGIDKKKLLQESTNK
jgi:hypothetical protein